jgi:DNA replication and repair protein RecF
MVRMSERDGSGERSIQAQAERDLGDPGAGGAAVTAGLRVSRLQLTDLRSYRSLDARFGDGPQILWGANAAGKTNLLEAIVLLARGRSQRTTRDVELIAWERPFARVLGAVDVEGRSVELEVAIQREAPGGARKRVRIDGVPRRPTALGGVLRVVVFAPEDMLFVSGSPGLRRGEIDTLAAQLWAVYGSTLATYGRAIQQRNGLLRAIAEGSAGRDELAFWDRILVEQGGEIVGFRLALLERLAGPLAAAHREIAPAEGRLVLRYETNSPLDPARDAAPADALRRRLGEVVDKEIWNGATLVGPHRDDVVFELDGRALETFASRGQQRTAILALKLAELELLGQLDGRPPLLLLDDVFSELDEARRGHLVRRVTELPQAFVTTASIEEIDPGLLAAATRWRVAGGSLTPDR